MKYRLDGPQEPYKIVTDKEGQFNCELDGFDLDISWKLNLIEGTSKELIEDWGFRKKPYEDHLKWLEEYGEDYERVAENLREEARAIQGLEQDLVARRAREKTQNEARKNWQEEIKTKTPIPPNNVVKFDPDRARAKAKNRRNSSHRESR